MKSRPIKIAACLAGGLLCWGTALAEDTGFGVSHDRGFSYFVGLGQQTTHYSETATTVGVRSTASTRSALLVAGALYAVHPDVLVALDNTSTFAPGNTTERWQATGATLPFEVDTVNHVYEARPVNGPLLQLNRFSLSQNSTRILAHYRAMSDVFLVGGATFHTQSFKRFSYNVLQPDFIQSANSQTVVEESSNEVLAEVGLAMESERVKKVPTHYSLRVSVATPLWRRLDNTGAPDVTFNSTKGWDFNLEGRYSVAIHDLLHIGAWTQYAFSERGRQVQGVDELPMAHTRSLAYGIELLWKL